VSGQVLVLACFRLCVTKSEESVPRGRTDRQPPNRPRNSQTKTCFEMFVSSGGQDCPKTYYIIWLPAATGRNKFTILYISWLPAYSRSALVAVMRVGRRLELLVPAGAACHFYSRPTAAMLNTVYMDRQESTVSNAVEV